MIKKGELFRAGRILKPHGLKGEVKFDFETNTINTGDVDCFILEIEGILVPFFVEEYRSNGNLVKFQNIDTPEQAKELNNAPIYLPLSSIAPEEEIEDIHRFTFFDIEDEMLGYIGRILHIDDNTENVLFVVSCDGNEILIPAADDLVLDIDNEKRIIYMRLPEGLVERRK